jgi:hypothetical protein
MKIADGTPACYLRVSHKIHDRDMVMEMHAAAG